MNIAASPPVSLEGERLGEGPTGTAFLELTERSGPSRWRAVRTGGATCVAGDQIRFGDQSNRACFLGTLNATVAGIEPDGSLSLDFDLYGAALDEMVAALMRPDWPWHFSAGESWPRRNSQPPTSRNAR